MQPWVIVDLFNRFSGAAGVFVAGQVCVRDFRALLVHRVRDMPRVRAIVRNPDDQTDFAFKQTHVCVLSFDDS